MFRPYGRGGCHEQKRDAKARPDKTSALGFVQDGSFSLAFHLVSRRFAAGLADLQGRIMRARVSGQYWRPVLHWGLATLAYRGVA